MRTKAIASIRTLFKYLVWTGIAAVLVALADKLPNVQIPAAWIPILGGLLKSAATWAATQAEE
jgi:hypothetical protein